MGGADTFQMLMGGFATALEPMNLLFALVGCILGTVIGVLPGIGPLGGTAMLIPVTFVMDPIPAIIMLSAIYYGTCYGGTITSVLMNTPGEAASAITCLEGYEMAKRGRAGAALSAAAIGSFVGGTFATIMLAVLALPLASLALKFQSPDFLALMVLGLSLVTVLAGKSLVKALLSALLGMLIASVGVDPVMGAPRFTFGVTQLLDGVGLVPVAMGLFGIGEILLNLERPGQEVFDTKMSSLWLSAKDMKDSFWPIVRGTGIGFLLGLIPGVGTVVPTFISYAAEKMFSKTPHKFGTGMIEGVAGPETANNAYANAAMIPLFTLGIPGSPTIAVLMGAFMMNGLTPGPLLFRQHADFAWAVIASLYVGNVMLLILNLPLIPLWVSFLRIPYSILFAVILLFAVIGCYSVSSSAFDVGVMVLFGILGYVFKKLDFPIAPLILTLILGPLMEQALRRSLELSAGSFSIFFTRPMSGALLAISLVVVIVSMLRMLAPVQGRDSQV